MPKGERTKQVAFRLWKEGKSFDEGDDLQHLRDADQQQRIGFVDWERGRQGVWEPKLPD